MKKELATYTIVLLLLSIPVMTQAQRIAKAKFEEAFQAVPKPKTTLEETMRYYSEPETHNKLFENVFADQKVPTAFIQQSFYERFLDNFQKVKKNKALLAQYSLEERRLMEGFEAATIGLTDDLKFDVFARGFESRPLVSAANFSWDKIKRPLSSTGQSYYQQLLQIEKSLGWAQFKTDYKTKSPTENWLGRDEELMELNHQYAAQLDKVPTKKIKVMEGSDVTVDMADPDKVVALMEATQKKRRQIMEKNYNELYRWWHQNFSKVQGAAAKMDVLLVNVNHGESLNGSDQDLVPLMAGVQLRIWEMLTQLTIIAGDLVQKGQWAKISEQELQEGKEMYKKFGAGIADK